jgi:sporulation protein YlmC with PRC-barrel domain
MKSLAKGFIVLSAGALLMSAPTFAQSMSSGHTQLMTTVPSSSLTVTDWYKQPVYDPSNAKIGDINDVLVGSNGEINAVIVGVGGFLGAGEKDVAVNFNSVKKTMKDNKTYLTLDTTKDALKNAPGFKYDSDKTSWVPVKD